MSLTVKQKGAIDLAKRQLVDSIYTSTCIERLGTTFPDTQKLLDNMEVTTTLSTTLFIVNMKRAWNFLLDNIDYDMCLMFLRELNKICGDNLIYGSGDLRTVDVTIGNLKYKPRIPIAAEVAEKLAELNLISDAKDRAIETFCYLAKAQIFIDGNKRVAQLAANKILICSGVGILRIPPESVDEFTDLLIDYYEGVSDKLKEFLHSCIMESAPISSIEYKGKTYAVQDVIAKLPFSVRANYDNDTKCAEDYIEAYVKSL